MNFLTLTFNVAAAQAERQSGHGYALHVELYNSVFVTFFVVWIFLSCFHLDFFQCKFYLDDDAANIHVFSI
jgi:hypothetical protein